MHSDWTQVLNPIGHKCGGRYHHSSGWIVQHCGHPTALWPYALLSDQWPDRTIVSFNGLGFQTAAGAKGVVEGILSGRFHVTTERCVYRVARVRDADTFGEPVAEPSIHPPNTRRLPL